MPRRPAVASLRHAAILAVGRHFELVCYGCRDQAQLGLLLDTSAYLQAEVPAVTSLPASLLEDLYSIICRRRCAAHYLHVLIQPQIRHLEIQPGTIHHAITLLQERCRGLRSLSLTGSTHVNPELFIPIFQHFPNLVKIDLSGNVIDDRTFGHIGVTCHRLRSLDVSRSTVSDMALQLLSRSQHNIPRCQELQHMNLARTRVTRAGVASFLYYHPALRSLQYEDTLGALTQVDKLGCGEGLVLDISSLTSEGEDGDTDTELRRAVGRVPGAARLELVATRLTSPGLYPAMSLRRLRQLSLANTDLFRIDFDEGVAPVLAEVGGGLHSLELDRFRHVDISLIGRHCPQLRKLGLSHIIHYSQLLTLAEDQFTQLEDVVLENQYGSCIVSNILRQLLLPATGLQSLSLQLVDSLDDVVWAQLTSANPLQQLVTLTIDQCHSISGDVLLDLVTGDNDLQLLQISSCRFVTAKHREAFKKIIAREHYDLSMRILPFMGFTPLPRPPFEDEIEELDVIENLHV